MKISHREKEIIQLVADELTTKEIAAQLYISNHTVITHRKNMMEKLEVKNVAGLIRNGFDIGLLRIAMILLLTLQLPYLGKSQEISIGLEVDKAHDVLFGTPLDSSGNSFYWSPRLGTLIVGSDDAFFHPNIKYDLDSIGRWSAIFGLANKIHGHASLSAGEGNTIEYGSVYSTTFGSRNTITSKGALSTVWGITNMSKVNLATIWGSYNTAEKNATSSTIWGNFNKSNAANSTVWGLGNITDNMHTTAFGESNRAGGRTSTVMGLGNVAKGYAALVTGTYCDTLNGQADQSAFFDTTPLFVIGNGTGAGETPRSNALSVFGSGRVKIGNGTAGSDLHIKQSQSIIQGGTGGIRFEGAFPVQAADYWQIYNSGSHFSFSKQGTRRAYISEDGAFVDDENFAPNSDEITKSKSIVKEDILKVNIIKSSSLKKKEEIMINAFQMLKDFPELIVNDENGDPFGIDYRQLYLMAIASLQEEIKINQRQQEDIDGLKEAILK
ncbi:MAG: DNA-binding CsgD family transcriptional regulator [Saprospiraceae bacterium]|jgi:DNA-binding CsgD family transcriptional regulator